MNPSRTFRPLLYSLVLIFFTAGCVGLIFENAPVLFDDPRERLGITEASPTDAEKDGILLRLKPTAGGETRARQETTMYVRIRNGQGIKWVLNLERSERDTSSTERPGNFVRLARSRFEKEGGKLIEEYETSDRGEIVRFIQGKHESRIGKFQITDWKRSALFPENKVKPRDTWDSEERMNIRIQSFWIKQKDPAPHEIRAQSELVGFALVKGRRAAVLRTKAEHEERQRFKVLFKNLDFTIHTRVEETAYFDYEKGVFLARISNASSETSIQGLGAPERGQSRTVDYLL